MLPFYLVLSLFVAAILLSVAAIRIAAFQWKQKKGLSYQPSIQYSIKNKETPPESPESKPEPLQPELPEPIESPQPELLSNVVSTAEVPSVLVEEERFLEEGENNKQYLRKKWLRNWLLGEIID